MTDRNGAEAGSPYAPGPGWAPPPRPDPRPGPPGTNGANGAPAPAPRPAPSLGAPPPAPPPPAPRLGAPPPGGGAAAPAGAGDVPWWGFADQAGRGLSSTGGAPPPGWGDPPPPAPAAFGPPPGPAPQWGPPPAPQWGPPPGPGWGPRAGYGPQDYGYPGQTHIRHRPGIGLALGLFGLVLLVVSHTALPWYSVDLADGSSESVTLGEIGDMLSDLHESVVSGGLSVPQPDPTATVPATIPPVTDGGGGPIGVPVTPAPVTPTPLSPVGGSAEVDEDYAFLRYYANGSWIMLVVFGVLAVVFSCWWVPRSRAGRGVTGFVMLGVFGLTVNLVDEKGAVGSRICAVAGVLIGTLLYGAAVVKVFNHDGSPGYGPAIYVGACGLLLMLVGCAIGTRRESVPGPA